MLVGHGPNSAEDNAAWMDNRRRVADWVKASEGFTDVPVGLLRDDAPAAVRAQAVLEIRNLTTLQAKAIGHPVVVIPILVANGSMSRTTVPTDLAGLLIKYGNAALLPHPALARWVERMVREAAQPKTAQAMKASQQESRDESRESRVESRRPYSWIPESDFSRLRLKPGSPWSVWRPNAQARTAMVRSRCDAAVVIGLAPRLSSNSLVQQGIR